LKNIFTTTSIISTYQKIPFYFRWLFSPIKLAIKIFRIFRFNIWIITGKDSLKNQFSIIYAGSERHKNYIENLVFDDIYSEIIIGKWLWDIFKISQKKSNACSLMVLQINYALRSLFDNEKSFYIPCWISGEVDISIDTSLITRANSSIKSDIRRIKKHNLQFELAKGQYHFDNFYNNMYLPYITMTHGDRAILMTYGEMKKQIKNCDLLLIKMEKEHVGGILIIYENNVPRLWSIGIKEGGADFLKAGVIGALYYFSVEYLKEKGYKKVRFGVSRAFLEDGVLQYKKKWGLKIVNSKKKGFLIKPLSLSIATKGFLINNPFIYVDQDGLTGSIFLENDQFHSEKSFKRLYEKYKMKGVSKFVVYLFGGDIKNINKKFPTESSDRITICSAESLF